MTDPRAFTALVSFLEKIPPVSGSIGTGDLDGGGWSDGLLQNPPDERQNSPILPWASVAELERQLRQLALLK